MRVCKLVRNLLHYHAAVTGRLMTNMLTQKLFLGIHVPTTRDRHENPGLGTIM